MHDLDYLCIGRLRPRWAGNRGTGCTHGSSRKQDRQPAESIPKLLRDEHILSLFTALSESQSETAG